MSEQNINNNIEEEIEENQNEQNQEEYEEENINQQVEEEEGQEFEVAFDIQINDISYILLIGKTEESKLILRLVDKEDDTKPFYQNEFSLEELKEINNYFLNFTNENDAIDSIIKNLNENDKEIEILDENNIKLTVQLNEESGNNVDFILPKISYEFEGEYEQINNIQNGANKINIRNEEDGYLNKDGIEEVENENENENIEEENYMEHEEANLEYSEENNEKQEEMDSSPQNQNIENINIDNKVQIQPKNEEQNIQNEFISDKKKENTLSNIIADTNQKNINNNDNIQNQEINLENEEKKEINEIKEEKEKEAEKNGEETKISKVIEELKNNLDSLGGAMNYMEQQDEEEQEQNMNENEINIKNNNEDFSLFKKEIIKMFNQLSENFNSQQKLIKEENDKKMKELENKLNMKDNELNDIKNNFKTLNEKINNIQNETKKEINKLNDEIRNIKNQENTPSRKYDRANIDNYKKNNNELEKITNNMNLKIKDIEQKINNMKNDINKNNKTNENINIRSLFDRMNIFENKLKKNDETLLNNTKLINDKKNNTDNKILSMETKLSNIETSIKERKNLYDRISTLENKSKGFDNKINNLENNKKTSNDIKEIIERLNNLENLTNDFESEKKELEEYCQKKIEELNNTEIINQVNNLINLSNKHETNIKKLNESFNDIKKQVTKKMSKTHNISKQPNKIGELYQQINISGDERRKPITANVKKQTGQKLSENDINRNNMVTKNYRIMRQIEDQSIPEKKKYISQTYNRDYKLESHSMNRLNIKPANVIDNNVEYQINTRPRSRSKENKRKKEQQNTYESQPLQKNYRTQLYSYPNTNINQYENGINESNIIEVEDDIAFIDNRLSQLFPNNDFNYNLVYRATEDGDKASDFHKRCDKIGPNITLVKTKNGYVFGGFTTKNWEHLKRDININKPNLGSASRDPNAFGFSVNYQKIYENERKNEFAIWCNRNYGPTFKNNFFQIYDNSLQKGGYCSVRHNSHYGGQNSDYEISGGEPKFKISEIEVFEIKFQ